MNRVLDKRKENTGIPLCRVPLWKYLLFWLFMASLDNELIYFFFSLFNVTTNFDNILRPNQDRKFAFYLKSKMINISIDYFGNAVSNISKIYLDFTGI